MADNKTIEYGPRVDGDKRKRVNITLSESACILYLRWEPGLKGSEQHAQELLSALAPLR